MDEENNAQFYQQPADVCSLDWYIGPNQTQISWDCMVLHTVDAVGAQYLWSPAQNEETETMSPAWSKLWTCAVMKTMVFGGRGGMNKPKQFTYCQKTY